MRYVVIILLGIFIFSTLCVISFVLGAVDYDPSWDEHQEAKDHDDAG